jgi:acetyl esterase/lipase
MPERNKIVTNRSWTLLFVGFALSAASLTDLYGTPMMEPTYPDVRYGVHERNVMDVWLARGEKPTPCVMIIHGGGWVQGDKRAALDGLPRYLSAGISVVSINYRYLKQTLVDSGSALGAGPVLPRGDYPEPPVREPLEDAARALQFIRHNAAEWSIDPVRVAVTGGSAGACSCLWLNYHDDLADPKAEDPVKRQSTKPWCAAVEGAQTSLDPKQVQEWIPNTAYGMGAFGFLWDKSDPTVEFRSGLRYRDEILAWIKEYSPYELVTRDDPPVYLYYHAGSPRKGQAVKDPNHSSNYGALLAEKLDALGLDYEFVHEDSQQPKHATVQDYLITTLKEQRCSNPTQGESK